jgi:deazaflavin-dependent oxidoreductase (nitroreductase family)
MGRVRPEDPKQRKGPWLNFLVWAARQRPVTWYLVNWGNKVDPFLMKISGGRLKSTSTAPTVLLTHTGAKSGKVRKTPLAYFTDGEDVVLIASKGGADHNPSWFYNVRANPEVELFTSGGGGRYRAREASDPAERDRLWGLATSFYPGFGDYQERAADHRTIPVVVCEPLDPA